MSHILNYQRRISAENEYPKIKKIKTFKKQNRKRSSNNLKNKDVKSHRESLNNVELGLQNFLSKALVNNTNDTKYFNVNEELEEIEKNKKKQKKQKKEDEYYHNKNNEFKRLLTITSENKNENILPSNQIGLGLFKKAQSNKKMNYKFKSVKTILDKRNSLNNYIPEYSDSSMNNFLTSTEKFNTQKNSDLISPINKQFVDQLRKNDFERPKSKPNKIPQSLQNNLNLLRNNIKSQFEKKIKNKNEYSNSYINENNNIETKNNTQIKSNEKNMNFTRKNNRERSQVVNKWLIYSKLISSVEPNNDDIKLKEKGKKISNFIRKKKNYKTISPIHSSDMQNFLKINNKKKNASNNTLNIENTSISKNSLIEISKNFSRKKFKKFTQYCNKLKDKLIIQPKKSKTNLLEEEERRDSLLNLKTLTDNVLNPKYKTMTNMNPEISLIERKSYVEEEKSESSEIGKTQFLLQELKEIRYRHLVRLNKLVYDSLSDEESDEVYEITGYINPNSKFKFFFDIIIFLFSFYYIIFFPIILCYYPILSSDFKSWYLMINIIIDLFYIIDLIIGFFTAYYDIEEIFIKKLTEISVNYLSGWFLIDLLSAIPFNTIFAITNRKNKYMVTYTELFKLTELFESFRIMKIYKSYLNNELTHFIKKNINKIDYLQKSIEISIFIAIVVLHVHYLTCVNIFLSNLQYPNWITVQNLQDSTKFDIYIASFYYVFATVTTVGYGDIVSINIYERFYNLILLVVGIGIYSYSVSALSNYVQQVDRKTLDYQEKSDTLEQIRINHEKMPNELYEKIARFLKYQLENESIDQHEIIDNLPIGLRTTLIMQMYKPIINNFIFFKTFNSSDFIIKVIMAFRPILSLRNEKLVNEGDYIEEIIFVKRGVLALELPLPIYVNDKDIENYMTRRATGQFTTFDFSKTHTKAKFNEKPTVINFNDKAVKTMTFIKGKGLTLVNNDKNENYLVKTPVQQYVRIIEIRKNEHFGDILMFLNRRSPLCMKVKTKYAELFLLNKTDAVEISMSFPKIWNQIIKKSLFNMEQIERLINKTLKFFYKQNNHYKRNSLYIRNLNQNNEFVNLDYSNLSSKDYELQSIPSSFSDDNESKTEELISSGNDSSSNFESENSQTQSLSSKNETKSNNSILKSNKKIHEKKNSHVGFLNMKNETIKEELAEDENDDINIKNSIVKIGKISSKQIDNKEIISEKKIEEEDKKSNDTHIIFSSSSISKQISGTDSKTLKENEENILDFNSISSKNNSLVYPYSKSEINNEVFPFEINSFNVENNKNIIPNIVPKIPYFNIYGKPNNLIESSKITKESFYTTSSFSILIESSIKKFDKINSNISELIIVKNESFMLNVNNKHLIKCNTENKLSLAYGKNEDDEQNKLRKINSESNLKTSLISKDKKDTKKLNKLLDLEQGNNNKKENITQSNNKNLSTLNLIEKNIESNSLALNNPKMFYQNYFNNFVNREKKIAPRKSVVIRLKDIEKIIKTNQPGIKNQKIGKTRSYDKEET